LMMMTVIKMKTMMTLKNEQKNLLTMLLNESQHQHQFKLKKSKLKKSKLKK